MNLLTDLIAYATLFVTISSAICAVTPTPKDDAFLGKYVYPVIELIALNIGKAKEGNTANPIRFVKRSD